MTAFFQILRTAVSCIKSVWNWINRRAITRRIFIAMLAVPMLITGVSNKRATNSFAQPSPTPTEAPEAIDRRELILNNLVYQTAPVEESADMDEDAAYIAKVLYGTARNNSEHDQILCIWCIINRCENASYPSTIQGVCQQNQQWMGYSDSNPITQSLYDLALSQLSIWRSDGVRPCGPEYIFMSWNSEKITLRTTFEETAQTRYHS